VLTILILLFVIINILNFKLILGWVLVFLSFLFMFLQVLFFTSCERKLLALAQRRLGPHVVGDRGRLQFLADALKLVAKNSLSPRNINTSFFQASALGAF
jgi:NADH:ubiquinone oxidoreductase subunit H